MKQKITRFPIEHATIAIPGYKVPNLEPQDPVGTQSPVSTVNTTTQSQSASNRLPEALITLDLYQQDWMPGFAAFRDDGSIQEGAHPKLAINVGALLAAVAYKDLAKKDLPYVIAESVMHEFIHVLESWAGVEFNEDKVEELLGRYRQKALSQKKMAKKEKK